MKFMTEGEAESKRQKAVEFLQRIGNDEAAGRFEDMTAADYAAHRGAELLDNPRRRKAMAHISKTKAELEAEIQELREENEELQDQLDAVADIVSPADEDEDEEDDDTAEDDDQGEE